ncbi:MAG: hypothetical protein QME65_05535 [Candidatus Omnitrophota bacterium]|nr:hypothetical protein [Candidatus Omnitrophota bacterium]
MRGLFALVILFTLCKSAFGEERMPSLEELGMIEFKGRQIVEYERVALKAAELLPPGRPDLEKLENYVAVKEPGLWGVYFGRVSDYGSKFHAAYIYSCPADAPDQIKLQDSGQDIYGEVLELAKAVKLAVHSIAGPMQFPRYNTYVFREQDATITVYLIPGNDLPGIAVLGGDFKFSISKNGSKIINKTKLHKEALEIPLTGNPEAFNKHFADGLPTETDVSFVLLYPMAAPHYVIGPKWMSRIDADGKIYILGKSNKMLKGKNK